MSSGYGFVNAGAVCESQLSRGRAKFRVADDARTYMQMWAGQPAHARQYIQWGRSLS
jgi:hypothetical protein